MSGRKPLHRAERQPVAQDARFGLSFWDALILQAAQSSGAGTLYTEDLNHGQRYGSVEAIDPFR